MKASIIALATAVGIVSAGNATVHNGCQNPVYLQSFPYDHSTPGYLVTLQPGQQYSERFRPSGSTIKMSKNKYLESPLFFGYSFSSDGSEAFYELSNQWGNPFANKHNILSPGSGCASFDCAANDTACYSTPPDKKKVFNCPQPIDLTASLCA